MRIMKRHHGTVQPGPLPGDTRVPGRARPPHSLSAGRKAPLSLTGTKAEWENVCIDLLVHFELPFKVGCLYMFFKPSQA